MIRLSTNSSVASGSCCRGSHRPPSWTPASRIFARACVMAVVESMWCNHDAVGIEPYSMTTRLMVRCCASLPICSRLQISSLTHAQTLLRINMCPFLTQLCLRCLSVQVPAVSSREGKLAVHATGSSHERKLRKTFRQ